MAVKCEQVETNLSKLTFEVSSEEFEKAIDRAYRRQRSKFSVPGFRKGKVPKAVIYRYYSKSVFYDEALNDVLQDAFKAALDESGLNAAAAPEIDVEDIKDGEPVVFTALITTMPVPKLPEYKGIKVGKIDYTVSDEDVDREIEKQRENNARLVSVDDRAVESGDTAVIDFEGFIDGVPFDGGKGENYDLEIGSNTFIPGFEDQLIGASVDETVEVKVTFPEEYHSADVAGKDAVFNVTVKEITVKELPELDDDFAAEISEFDTFDEYKADVRKKLEERAEERAKTQLNDKIIKKIVDNSEFELPEVMIENQIDRRMRQIAQDMSFRGIDMNTYLQYSGRTEEAMREELRESATYQIRSSIVLDNIATAEGIEISPEEFELRLTERAKAYNMEPEAFKNMYDAEGKGDNLKAEFRIDKTIEMLANNAEVVDEDDDDVVEDKNEEKTEDKADKSAEDMADMSEE